MSKRWKQGGSDPSELLPRAPIRSSDWPPSCRAAGAANAFRNLPSFPIFLDLRPHLVPVCAISFLTTAAIPPTTSSAAHHPAPSILLLRSARRPNSHLRTSRLHPPSPETMSFSLVMRRSGLAMGRRMVRFESTSATTKAAEAAKQTASQASSAASEASARAAQGLSRVTSTAGPAIANAAKGVTGALGRVGGRTGRLVAFVERKDHRPPPVRAAAYTAATPRQWTTRGSVVGLLVCWRVGRWPLAVGTWGVGSFCVVVPMANRDSPLQARPLSSSTTPRSALRSPGWSSGART